MKRFPVNITLNIYKKNNLGQGFLYMYIYIYIQHCLEYRMVFFQTHTKHNNLNTRQNEGIYGCEHAKGNNYKERLYRKSYIFQTSQISQILIHKYINFTYTSDGGGCGVFGWIGFLSPQVDVFYFFIESKKRKEKKHQCYWRKKRILSSFALLGCTRVVHQVHMINERWKLFNY